MTGPTWGDKTRQTGSGGLDPKPLNAPETVLNAVGVQPGAQNGIFIGRLFIAFGPSGVVSGVFIYGAGTTPGLGNPPVVYITQATQDPFGNPLISALIGLQNGPAKLLLADSGGFVSANFYTGSLTELLNASIIATTVNPGLPGEQQFWQAFGPENTVSADRAVILLASSPNNVANSAGGTLIYGDSTGGQHNLVSWGAQGVSRQSLAGLSGGIPLNQMDFFTRTINTVGVQNLTRSYSIPANDAANPFSQQTTYHLKAWGNGNGGNPAQTATWTINMFGTTIFTIGPSAWTSGAAHTFNWLIDCDVEISGNSATASFIAGGFMMFVDTTAGTSVTQPIIGGATVNNTASGTMFLNWNWAGVTGGASISCPGSIFTRKGV